MCPTGCQTLGDTPSSPFSLSSPSFLSSFSVGAVCHGHRPDVSVLVPYSTHSPCPLWSAAVDMAGGTTEGAAGRRVRRVGGGRPGSHQALRPAAADHTAGDSQRDQGRGGPHPAAEVGLTPTPHPYLCLAPHRSQAAQWVSAFIILRTKSSNMLSRRPGTVFFSSHFQPPQLKNC